MYTSKTYNSDTITAEEFDEIETFLMETVDRDEPASVNMCWEPAGLLHNVKNKSRWRQDQGLIYLIFSYDRAVAISCVEYPENSTQFAIGGIRTYLKPECRATGIMGYVLGEQETWARSKGCDFMVVTFNDYNKTAHTAISLGPKYRRAAGWSAWWDDTWPAPEPVVIRHTRQWAVIKPVLVTDPAQNYQTLLNWEINNTESKSS